MIERNYAPDDEPQVIVAKGGELLRQIEEFTASPIWREVEAVLTATIDNAHAKFEQGGYDDSELRGASKTARRILNLPGELTAVVKRDIDNNRGKI